MGQNPASSYAPVSPSEEAAASGCRAPFARTFEQLVSDKVSQRRIPSDDAAYETLWGILSSVCRMVWVHAVHFIGILTSLILCCLSGAVKFEVIDLAWFRAMGLLLAVLMSLRAKNALTRRSRLISNVLGMMNSARTILDVCGGKCAEKRWRLRSFLRFALLQAAANICGDHSGVAASAMPSMQELHPDDRLAAFCLRGKASLKTYARPLLLYLQQLCDDVFDAHEHTRQANHTWLASHSDSVIPISFSREGHEHEDCLQAPVDIVAVIRRHHTIMRRECRSIVIHYDALMMYSERFLTAEFKLMLSSLIFLYIALYPWCVQNESKIVLYFTTFGLAVVFYGLNSMTEHLEDPTLRRGQGFNLILSFWSMMEQLEKDDKVRALAQKFCEERTRRGESIDDSLHRRFEMSAASRIYD